MYTTCTKYHNYEPLPYILYTVSLSDFETLREQVKELMELIHKLIGEFQAVKHEVEAYHLDIMKASHLDIMNSVQLAVAACKMQHSSTQ